MYHPDMATIAVVHPDHIRAEFAWSLLAVQATSKRLAAVKTAHSGPNISRARNHLVQGWLDAHESGWLLMLDTDMVFPPDLLDRLLIAADPTRRPVVGGLCLYRDTDGRDRATMYELVQDGEAAALVSYAAWPDDQLVQVSATGAACLLIHRSAVETVKRGHNGKHDRIWPWFRESSLGDRQVGEDITFCMRLGVAHIPIFVHTGIRVGHLKSTMIGEVR